MITVTVVLDSMTYGAKLNPNVGLLLIYSSLVEGAGAIGGGFWADGKIDVSRLILRHTAWLEVPELQRTRVYDALSAALRAKLQEKSA